MAEAKGKLVTTRKYYYAHGKRKTAIARTRLLENGKGDITVNERPFEEYFPIGTLREKIKSPLKICGSLKTFDIVAKIIGGGIASQAHALQHGISKALIEFSPELRATLKRAGMITRDSRVKERKKFGLKKARRAPQWAKR